MDSVVDQAARALALGDPLRALQGIALRDDAPALALRGIAMAQLGELARARQLLKRAARSFGATDPVARARCTVASAEVALANRDLSREERELADAVAQLVAHGDLSNAAQGALVIARRLVMLGRFEEAEDALAAVARKPIPARLVAGAQLVLADLATRKGLASRARICLKMARDAAQRARIPALLAEVQAAVARLDAPVARQLEAGNAHFVRLDEVEALQQSHALVVDACRRELRVGRARTPLLDRPVLFELLWVLGEAFPSEAPRALLIQRAFGLKRVNESARVRLRVEIGRLRKVLARACQISAGPLGFVLTPIGQQRVVVLAPPSAAEGDALLALLGDGQAWSTSALAQALGKSQRSVQRALATLGNAGKVAWFGHGRSRRWQTPAFTRFATPLLLLTPATSR